MCRAAPHPPSRTTPRISGARPSPDRGGPGRAGLSSQTSSAPSVPIARPDARARFAARRICVRWNCAGASMPTSSSRSRRVPRFWAPPFGTTLDTRAWGADSSSRIERKSDSSPLAPWEQSSREVGSPLRSEVRTLLSACERVGVAVRSGLELPLRDRLSARTNGGRIAMCRREF